MSVRQFEEIVFAQRPIPAEHYDREYFHSNWRAGSNNYTLEIRRSIEGKNPQLIKEVFQPQCALDFGCGPGVLIYLLWELGVYAEGIDFSPYAKQSAPEVIRDRIHVLPGDKPLDLGRTYDLVICREVLEHLTVLQIQQAVQNMCRLSSRFIYVTTRYSKRTQELLAVDAEPEVDATHISLLNKDFLRCLFVLQGFRSRPDLEARMDWKNYGRVLVLEKAV
ncbi:MAG: class I SAM-dependent methyltransferase [Gemmatales bacterium]|nr:class I SAM-dependent methyltransferase [Gemmatales bacterium]MDW8385629.1 class I SAM-dependent methyltransferase [Gemmatales bacterium]